MEQMQYRFCATGIAVAGGGTVLGMPVDCDQSTVDYLISQPQYKTNWFEVRGGALGPGWVKVVDIIREPE